MPSTTVSITTTPVTVEVSTTPVTITFSGAQGPQGPTPSGTGLVSVTAGVYDTPSTLRSRVAADASNLRSDLGLGGAAVLNVGTTAGTVAAGNHNHALVDIDIAGASEISGDLADGDLIPIRDVSGTPANKSSLMSRVWTYVLTKIGANASTVRSDIGAAPAFEVKDASFTAANSGNYICIATLTVTDPTPSEGLAFTVNVRNGTITVGGTAYSTAGTVIRRVYHSGAWASYITDDRTASDSRYGEMATSALSNDHGGVTSSTVLVDSGISLTLTAGTYEISCLVHCTANASGGARAQITADSATGTAWNAMCVYGDGSNGIPRLWALQGSGAAFFLGQPSAAVCTFQVFGRLVLTQTRTIKIQYAQAVSNASATVAKAQSFLSARKFA